MMITSCVSTKDVEYFQSTSNPGTERVPVPEIYEPLIESNDILAIHVASINPEATIFFNPSTGDGEHTGSVMTTYIVDADGMIEMPLIGKVHVSGLTTKQIRDTLRHKLETYLQAPTVRIYFENFKVTVLGEVRSPGVFLVRNEKITVTEALGLAGDMTIFAERHKVQIIRETEGKREFRELDLTRRDVFNSPYFYLHPDDILYIPAGKGRIASADNFYRIAPLVMSGLTLLSLLYIRLNQD